MNGEINIGDLGGFLRGSALFCVELLISACHLKIGAKYRGAGTYVKRTVEYRENAAGSGRLMVRKTASLRGYAAKAS